MKFNRNNIGWYLLILVSVVLIISLIPKCGGDVELTENSVYKQYAKNYREFERDSKRLRKDSTEYSKDKIRQRALVQKSQIENKKLTSKYEKSQADLDSIKQSLPDTIKDVVNAFESSANELISGLNKEIVRRDSLQCISELEIINRNGLLTAEYKKVADLEKVSLLLNSDKNALKKANRKQLWKGILIGLGTGAGAAGVIYGGIKAAQ